MQSAVNVAVAPDNSVVKLMLVDEMSPVVVTLLLPCEIVAEAETSEPSVNVKSETRWPWAGAVITLVDV